MMIRLSEHQNSDVQRRKEYLSSGMCRIQAMNALIISMGARPSVSKNGPRKSRQAILTLLLTASQSLIVPSLDAEAYKWPSLEKETCGAA